ncbi:MULTISPECIES: hypothetical protein [unclassified Nocardioides]|uniref:hypothetical protein n=1 Tax=unclassified Nocardioides TaxID=2615069 RepID=UPI0012FCD965|nr:MULTISPECIES: hypothetical protein [unclassified Nocardioides]
MASVHAVVTVLEDAGFERLPKPLTIAGTEFDFEAAVRGTDTSHDLVLVATDEVPRIRLQRLMAGLARSLDLAASRRPMSLVLIGGIAASDRTELERYARVLPIRSTTPGSAEIEEAVAVLLPLKLPNADLVHGSDPVNEVMAALGPVKATRDHFALIQTAADGPEAVREALRQYANDGAGWTDAPGAGDE